MTYNGWSTYETWLCKLWIDNDQGSQEYWLERAQQAHDRADLEEDLSDWLYEGIPFDRSGASLWHDLMISALQEINLHEVADSLLEDAAELKGTES